MNFRCKYIMLIVFVAVYPPTLVYIVYWSPSLEHSSVDCTPSKFSLEERSPAHLTSRLDDTHDIEAPRTSPNNRVRDCITWDITQQLSDVDGIKIQEFSTNYVGPSENAEKRKELFQKIFDERDWPADDPSYLGLKASGPGAMLRHAQRAIAVLHGVVSRIRSILNVSSVSLLDIPCGDLQWMTHFLDTRPDVVYTGADIVPDIIYHHRKKFKHLKNATFLELDVVNVPLDRPYDLVLIRDLLQHLLLADAMIALQRISNSGSRFLLATTFSNSITNMDVDPNAIGGRKSPYNLELSPFSLELPICSSMDWNTEHLSLWSLPLKQSFSVT